MPYFVHDDVVDKMTFVHRYGIWIDRLPWPMVVVAILTRRMMAKAVELEGVLVCQWTTTEMLQRRDEISCHDDEEGGGWQGG